MRKHLNTCGEFSIVDFGEFLTAIYNISLETVLSHLSPINIIYLTDGKKTKKVISTKDETGMKILKYLNLERFQ